MVYYKKRKKKKKEGDENDTTQDQFCRIMENNRATLQLGLE
jgi:hypothetical protein